MTSNNTNKTQQSERKIDTDALCREAHPVIKSCLAQVPSYYTKQFKDEMYNAAIVAILENCKQYDPDKGTAAFFYKHIRGAFDHFIATEIYSFSSYEKYRDYCKIHKVIPDIDTCGLTDDIYDQIFAATGLGKGAVKTALTDATIGKSYFTDSVGNFLMQTPDKDLSEYVCQMELKSVIDTALNCLSASDRDFVYDMCGFEGRDVLPTPKLLRKYKLTPTAFKAYIRELERKLMGSRKLRRYRGKVSIFEKDLVISA